MALLSTLILVSPFLFAECKPGGICCIQSILENKTPPPKHRYSTFAKVLKIIRQRNLEVFVVTKSKNDSKTDLSDGCGTLILADSICKKNGNFHSEKISDGTLYNVQNFLGDKIQLVKLTNKDSIDTLKNFNNKIDFLYLDSAKFDEKNPLASQEYILQELKAAYPWFSKNTLVIMDQEKNNGNGKGKLAIDFLRQNGWKIFHQDNQVVCSQ